MSIKPWEHYFKCACDVFGIPEKSILPKSVWYAYKNGALVGKANSRAEASSKYGTQIIEKVVENKDELDLYRKKKNLASHHAHNQWESDLREEYKHIPDKLFQIILEKASSKSYGYDDTVQQFEDYSEFALECIAAEKSDEM
jgi:hypothetical protein